MKTAVIGLGFGDEGKGRVVDWLCSYRPDSLVVRFSGGSNASHKVYKPDGSGFHAFSNLASGTFRGCPTYWSEFCTFDPADLLFEAEYIKKAGVENFKLYVNLDCPVVTTWDKRYNKIQNDMTFHGSCGVGLGATHEREENHYSLRVRDLFYYDLRSQKVTEIIKYYKSKGIKATLEEIELFFICVEKSKELFTPVESIPQSVNYLFEGSQGLMLDQNYGVFPHVTRSNTGTQNIIKMGFDMNSFFHDRCFLVTRAYHTRHGNGYHPTDHIPHNIKENPYEQNVENYQGKFRRGLLDVSLLKYAIEKDKILKGNQCDMSIVITCLDLIENEWRFVENGVIVNCLDEYEFLTKIKKLLPYPIAVSRTPYGKIEIFTL